jgi:hypothetical protein
MLKTILAILGIGLFALSVVMLRNGNYPTSGLMVLSVGTIMLLVAAVLKTRKVRNRKKENA